MTQRPSHEDGIARARAIGEETGASWAQLRQIAAGHLHADGWPEGEGMGSSDVSIHLAVMANYSPEELTERATRVAQTGQFFGSYA